MLAPEHDVDQEYAHVVTEDDEPVDNIYSERQQKLLWECLEASWEPGRPYVALSNVGLFHGPKSDPVVPDFLLSMGVQPPKDVWAKRNRSYFVSVYGKPPELVIEVVSNREGGEDTRKLDQYREFHVSWYAIFDPDGHLSPQPLRLFELRGAEYAELPDPFQPLGLGLALTLWEGEFGGMDETWLRWKDAEGHLLLTGTELAGQERARAEQERARAERLAARLRELGLDPD